MNGFWWTVWLVAIVAITIWALGGSKRRRARAIAEARSSGGLTEDDHGHLQRHVRMFFTIPVNLRTQVESIVPVLMADKNFEACGGLPEVTREMKVVIMTQAAFLLVGRRHDYFPRLRSILVYPDAYLGRNTDGENEGGRLGESWDSGTVVLSWLSVQRGGENDEDGRNVVLHEFAHQLDQENRKADGLPELQDRKAIGNWAHAFSEAYEEFCEDLDAGRQTVMDPYGATNPAEFFAVATETYFEKAKQLKEDAPALYEQLKGFYGLDPMEWDSH